MPSIHTNISKPKVVRKKQTPFTSGKFYTAPVTVDDKFVTIKLPKKVADYFELDKPEIYWVPINGVIQLSAVQPHMVIPMMSVDVRKFISQEDSDE